MSFFRVIASVAKLSGVDSDNLIQVMSDEEAVFDYPSKILKEYEKIVKPESDKAMASFILNMLLVKKIKKFP